ncbi:MAG: hypothetical protein GVY23_01925 [Spirochaetes bacterium]|jgi:hypothetical protein|nr:hypothetical protein [Spirochaetota bacterium]
MQLERVRPTVFRVTLHAYELSTLIAAARWAADGGEGELPDDARKQLRDLLDSYDRQFTVEQPVE